MNLGKRDIYKLSIYYFKSIKKISEATEKELTDLVGFSKGKLVFKYFHPDS